MHVVFFFLALVFAIVLVLFYGIAMLYMAQGKMGPKWVEYCIYGCTALACLCCFTGVVLFVLFSALAYIAENGVLL